MIHHLKYMTVILVICCSCAGTHKSMFLPDVNPVTENGMMLDHPENLIILIYNHGSTAEFKKDPCYPENDQNIWGTPHVIQSLSGTILNGKIIRVYALCSQIPHGDFNSLTRDGELKVIKRSEEINRKIEEFIHMGVPSNQIFLAGHSAGSWASLLVLKDNQHHINSGILFAPAFAGKSLKRNSGWESILTDQKKMLSQATYLPALVYVFYGDSYYRIEEFGFLKAIQGITIKPYKPDDATGRDCDTVMFSGHRSAFSRCFSESEKTTILDYIRRRLEMTE